MDNQRNTRIQRNSRILCAVFGIIWLLFTAVSLFKPVKAFSETENRYLQMHPEFSWKTFADGSYGQDYEAFIADQFFARDEWVTVKTYAQRARGMMDMSGIFFGSDGYLLENDGLFLSDNVQAKKNVDYLYQFLNTYASRMASLSLMLVPSGSSVIKDKLPAFAPVYPQEQWILEAYESLGEASTEFPRQAHVNFLNVFEALQAHREEEIYYRTDHHWTTRGAFLAYEQWARALGIPPLSENDFRIEAVSNDFYGTLYSKVHAFAKADSIFMYTPKNENICQEMTIEGSVSEPVALYDWNALNTKDKYAFFMGGNYGLVKIHTKGNEVYTLDERKLLIFKDSFANCFLPFASLHFKETVIADLRYMNLDIASLIAEEGITDILVLYNVKNFAEDKNIYRFQN